MVVKITHKCEDLKHIFYEYMGLGGVGNSLNNVGVRLNFQKYLALHKMTLSETNSKS